MLFAYLLQHLNDCASEANDEKSIKNCFQTFAHMLPQLFDLAQLNQENAHHSILEVIKEKHTEYRCKQTSYPGIEVLLFLKLISCLFSTSDFRHQIITPSFILMEQMLNKCKVRSRRDISYGLFLTALVLEVPKCFYRILWLIKYAFFQYTSLSKRYLGAAINFLAGVLHSAIPKTGVQLLKILPPFKSTQNLLVLTDYSDFNSPLLNLDVTDLLNKEIDDSFRIRSVYVAVTQLKDFYDNLEKIPSSLEIFSYPINYLKLIPYDKYPLTLQTKIQDLLSTFERSQNSRTLQYIVMEKKRPKALKLYEPKVEVV